LPAGAVGNSLKEIDLLRIPEPDGRSVEASRSDHQVLDRTRAEHITICIDWIDAKILRPLNDLPFSQPLHHFSVALPADLGEGRHPPDRLLVFVLVPAK
jgi:hypothetical protein